jgi:stage III sporulation protein SpoIIIAA
MTHARAAGLLLYHGTGNADGTNGDTVLLGPPFVVTDEELRQIAESLGDAVEKASAEASGKVEAPSEVPSAVEGLRAQETARTVARTA